MGPLFAGQAGQEEQHQHSANLCWAVVVVVVVVAAVLFAVGCLVATLVCQVFRPPRLSWRARRRQSRLLWVGRCWPASAGSVPKHPLDCGCFLLGFVLGHILGHSLLPKGLPDRLGLCPCSRPHRKQRTHCRQHPVLFPRLAKEGPDQNQTVDHYWSAVVSGLAFVLDRRRLQQKSFHQPPD